ncbi:MAG TPA: TerC/Alx family metal homeostasis membrane protein [Gemmatimonadales bacterium]|nr:TerC/Alx family metal homeostasis membrane protein [Gemmatimonadales bacterium]
MLQHDAWVWIGFTGLVLALLVVDLGVLNRRTHILRVREAALWSAGLGLLALGFGLFLGLVESSRHALEFYTGYLIELSLSVDNLFVFLLIFQYFWVPPALQARVLKWGIIGAMLMRGIMIGLGAVLLAEFQWITYLFGALLVVTGIRFYKAGVSDRLEPERNPLVRLARRLLPFTAGYEADHFFVRHGTALLATPLFLVVLVVEWSDLVFAIDSIPAIFAITRDPFIVYSSNVFAILGLRALYFVLAGAIDQFSYLKPAVATILVFVGLKMVGSAWLHVPTILSLAVILGLLTGGMLASIVASRRARPLVG